MGRDGEESGGSSSCGTCQILSPSPAAASHTPFLCSDLCQWLYWCRFEETHCRAGNLNSLSPLKPPTQPSPLMKCVPFQPGCTIRGRKDRIRLQVTKSLAKWLHATGASQGCQTQNEVETIGQDIAANTHLPPAPTMPPNALIPIQFHTHTTLLAPANGVLTVSKHAQLPAIALVTSLQSPAEAPAH